MMNAPQEALAGPSLEKYLCVSKTSGLVWGSRLGEAGGQGEPEVPTHQSGDPEKRLLCILRLAPPLWGAALTAVSLPLLRPLPIHTPNHFR